MIARAAGTWAQGALGWGGAAAGFALPQCYADLAYQDLTLRAGHFFTIIGYEVVQAPQNFFYSHAYTMQYGEPFTHTGGLLTWDCTDRLSVSGGLVNGWDKFDAEVDRLSMLYGVSWTSWDEATTLACRSSRATRRRLGRDRPPGQPHCTASC